MTKKRRTNFKKIIQRFGLEKVLKKPEKYLRRNAEAYSPNYLRDIKRRLAKTYGNATIN